jgi:hypothetical protein
MAQKIQGKIKELQGLVTEKENDVLFVLYKGSDDFTQCVCGRTIDIIALIAMAMSGEEEIAKIIEAACDAYTACKMNEKLKNKEI